VADQVMDRPLEGAVVADWRCCAMGGIKQATETREDVQVEKVKLTIVSRCVEGDGASAPRPPASPDEEEPTRTM